MSDSDRLSIRDLERMTRRGRTIDEMEAYAMPTYEQLLDTMRENRDFREALKMIAKPALGGKTQQWVAQQALQRNKDSND